MRMCDVCVCMCSPNLVCSGFELTVLCWLQVTIAAIILVWVYVLIGFDVSHTHAPWAWLHPSHHNNISLQIVHRTMAAFIGSTCTLAVLSMIDKVGLTPNAVG